MIAAFRAARRREGYPHTAAAKCPRFRAVVHEVEQRELIAALTEADHSTTRGRMRPMEFDATDPKVAV